MAFLSAARRQGQGGTFHGRLRPGPPESTIAAGARAVAATDTIYYDGTCALCHAAVRFVLARDRDGSRFRFAPLQGDRARASLQSAAAAELPDSIVVVTAAGAVLTRSDAVLHILGRLGGAWRQAAAAARLVPRRLRDAAYDGVALVRYRLFGRTGDACPIVPAHLRGRFDT